MSRAKQPTKNDSVQVRALVNRQVQAWEKHDFAIGTDLPRNLLVFPLASAAVLTVGTGLPSVVSQ